MTDKKNLFYLRELTDYKVSEGYTDVRGWAVEDASHRVIGIVDGLLVNKIAEKVVYLDVEVDKTILEAGHEPYQTPANEGTHEYMNKDGDNHVIIPVGAVNINEKDGKVYTESIDHDTFTKTKRFRKGTDINRDYEIAVLGAYFPEKKMGQNSSDDDRIFYNQREFIHH